MATQPPPPTTGNPTYSGSTRDSELTTILMVEDDPGDIALARSYDRGATGSDRSCPSLIKVRVMPSTPSTPASPQPRPNVLAIPAYVAGKPIPWDAEPGFATLKWLSA